MNKRWWWVIGTLGVVVAACIGALVRIGSDQGVKPDWYSAWASAASAFIAAAALVAAALAAKATIETNRTQTLQLARLEAGRSPAQ
ncbi:hypothetical protein A4R44_05012 [Amycolatopsis sp. M39]|nr:hypothetical protein A4R44_05012 [Amycolatopsis sp. M39]